MAGGGGVPRMVPNKSDIAFRTSHGGPRLNPPAASRRGPHAAAPLASLASLSALKASSSSSYFSSSS
jgi:hypothetical protein